MRAARAGRGRWLALLVLGLMSLPLSFPEYSPLARLRAAWFDFYQMAFPRARKGAPAVIVAIDEPSLRSLGPWPWPRTRLAELIRRIGEAGATAIGLDMVLPEADPTSPEALVPRLDPRQRAAIALLSAMPGNDTQLAETMERYPVVLGIAGAADAAAGAHEILVQKSVPVVHGGEIRASIRTYAHLLTSLPLLQAAASGQGTVNARPEPGMLRRLPLLSTDGTHLLPALALELARVAIGAPAIGVTVRDGAISAIELGELRIPTEPDGAMRIHFSAPAPSRYLSAAAILGAHADATALRERLQRRIAIVGITGLADADRRVDPRGQTIPGSDVHAQMLESFAERRFLLRPPWMPAAETGALLALGALLIAVTPAMRRPQALLLLASALVLTVALGFALFLWSGLLFDSAGVAIALLGVIASLVASALVQADQARRASERSLQTAREAAARVAGELAAARRIQLGILPRTESSFPRERRFELAAAIEPAQSVGGDLYDFFMLDADRLFFQVADVSGKGIPASLFMSITKVLTRSIVLRAGRDPEGLLTQANIELSRENAESLFVTAFAAILDANSGELTYWTAGHDTPLIRDATAIQRLDRSYAGPPLCTVAGFEYRPQRWRLPPGCLLVLYTDGIPEAENRDGERYGAERLARCVQNLPAGTSAHCALASIRADHEAFVAGAPASDDLTVLVLRWLGPRRDGAGSLIDAPA